jgi:AcrR family transcriptional regulator
MSQSNGTGSVQKNGKTGRRRGGTNNRARILEAALHEFADKGYDKTSVRGIARRVGCDQALVHQFFGTKERLFEEAVALPFDAATVYREALEHDQSSAGQKIVRAFFSAWDRPENRPKIMALLKSAMSDQARASQVASFITDQVLAPILPSISASNSAYRLDLIAGQLVGVLILRHALMVEPLASAPVENLVDSLGPVIDQHLSATRGPNDGHSAMEDSGQD